MRGGAEFLFSLSSAPTDVAEAFRKKNRAYPMLHHDTGMGPWFSHSLWTGTNQNPMQMEPSEGKSLQTLSHFC
jgi:hypothetical protein